MPKQDVLQPLYRAPWYPGFKLVVYLLLLVNTVAFAVDGTTSEGLDSIAWLTLLLLFELETAHAQRISTRGAARAVHAARFAAGAAVLAAAVGYVDESAWLDAANAWLWIAIVILLEIKVRSAPLLLRRLIWIEAVAAVLYTGLAVPIVLWAWNDEWFDAYDAALWLVAFVGIEMNVLERAHAG